MLPSVPVMARHETTEPAERLTGGDRLVALRLPTRSAGWVPEATPQHADDSEVADAPSPVAPSAPVTVRPVDLARGWAKDRLPPWLHNTVERATVGSVLTSVAVLIAVVVAVVMAVHRHASPGYSTAYPSSASGTTASAAGRGYPASTPDPVTSDTTSIVVDVGGRVRRPGLVTLPAGARVADAITAAGGPLRHRELAATNLAARVTDGQLLLIGATPAAGPTAATSGTSVAPVDVNSATLDELETLPGVGPVTGQKIIDWRTAHSGFSSVEQLQQVSGIGPATYAELSPLVTL